MGCGEALDREMGCGELKKTIREAPILIGYGIECQRPQKLHTRVEPG